MFGKIVFYAGVTIHIIVSLYLIIMDVHPYTAAPAIIIYSLYLSLAFMILPLIISLIGAIIKKFMAHR